MGFELNSRLQGAIFDLDGVIVDTVLLHFNAWKKMFAEYGKEFDFEAYKKKVDGISRFDGAKAILVDLPDDEIKKACDRKQSYFLEAVESKEVPIHPYTFKLIEELKFNSIKIANISASKNCRLILRNIGALDWMDAIVDGNDKVESKPDPAMFLLSAERLGVDPKYCVGFEDAVLGVEAVKRADMVCVGIDRYGEPERLKQADIVVSDLKEINYKKLLQFFV